MNTHKPLSSKIAKGLGSAMTLLIGVLCLWSCASDNIHQPEPIIIPDPVTYTGDFTSWIPAIPAFKPETCENTVTLKWQNEPLTLATLIIDEFDIHITMMGMSFTFGQMNITDVTCVRTTDGTMVFTNPQFECQAGQFHTTGTLSGTLSPDGTLDLTLTYKPGSMPFEVKSTFTSKTAA